MIKNRFLDLGFLPFVSNFFSENNIFFNFVKARLTGLASRKFQFLPKSKILNSHEKILMKTGQDQEIDCIQSISGRVIISFGPLSRPMPERPSRA